MYRKNNQQLIFNFILCKKKQQIYSKDSLKVTWLRVSGLHQSKLFEFCWEMFWSVDERSEGRTVQIAPYMNGQEHVLSLVYEILGYWTCQTYGI